MKRNFVKMGWPLSVALLFFVLVIHSGAKSPIITNPPPATVLSSTNAPLFPGAAMPANPSPDGAMVTNLTPLFSTNYFGAFNPVAGRGLTTNFMITAYTNPVTGMATNVSAVFSNNVLLGFSTNILQFALPSPQYGRAVVPPPFLQNNPVPGAQTNRSLGTPPLF